MMGLNGGLNDAAVGSTSAMMCGRLTASVVGSPKLYFWPFSGLTIDLRAGLCRLTVDEGMPDLVSNAMRSEEPRVSAFCRYRESAQQTHFHFRKRAGHYHNLSDDLSTNKKRTFVSNPKNADTETGLLVRVPAVRS